MKKHLALFFTTILTGAILVSSTAPALAAYNFFDKTCSSGTSNASVCQDANNSQGQTPDNNLLYGPNGVITKIANLLSLVIGIVAVFVIIIAGIRFMISGGDATKVATAKSTILYAVVGLVVAALAQAMIIFVLKKL